ncbi:MAG: tetratricopeptide repeat-containing sensor histidine kinase [Cyclobacteriaceae bacterium]|nr:tetratricopeptide repeat-containing sensor histidine kinase [Cyclobacteriaceae bacterium]
MNRIVGFFLLFALPVLVQAQNVSRIDSLKAALRAANGLTRFNLLNDLGFEYRLSYPDSTIYYCEMAYALGEELGVAKGLSKPLSFIGLAMAYKGDYQASFDYHTQAIELAGREGDSVQLGFGYNNFGRLFFDQGDMARAYSNFIRAEEIFASTDDVVGQSYVARSLANLYKSQNDLEKALRMSLKAYELRKAIGSPRGVLSALMELGLVYEAVGDSANAIRSLTEADSIAQSIDDRISQAEINLALAEYLLNGQDPEAATTAANAALRIVSDTDNQRLLPRTYLLLGRLNFQRANYPEAARYLKKVTDGQEGTSNMILQRDAHFYLSELYNKLGRKQASIEHSNRYLILKESLQNVDLTRQIERLIEKREKEHQLLIASHEAAEATLHRQRLQNIMLVIIIVFISLLSAVHWFNSRKRRLINYKLAAKNAEIQLQREEIIRQNENLSRRNMQLSELNHEKDTLMSIVAHDLKSPLNRISGLTDLLEMEGIDPQEQRTYIGMIKNATRAGLDLIKDLLDVNMLEENVLPEYSIVKLDEFLEDKMQSLRHAAAQKNIRIDISTSDHSVYTDADYLARIVDNLVSNAIKFSANDSVVSVSADVSDGKFLIRVKDDGPGFSEEDKRKLFQKFTKLSARPTGGESSNGLGLAIVKTLVDRLEGEITLRSQPKQGSEFVITFPQKQHATPA